MKFFIGLSIHKFAGIKKVIFCAIMVEFLYMKVFFV